MAIRGSRKYLSNQGVVAVEDVAIASAPASDPGATTAEALVVSVTGGNITSGGATANAAAPLHDEAETGVPLSVDLNGALRTIAVDPTTGAALDPTAAVPVTINAGTAAIGNVRITSAEYETVAASQTDQMMGPTGAVGDTIEGILVIPATTTPGAISIEDGATNTTVFAGGASSVSNLVPFFIPLCNIASVSGGWEITTGANVSCIVFGNFT